MTVRRRSKDDEASLRPPSRRTKSPRWGEYRGNILANSGPWAASLSHQLSGPAVMLRYAIFTMVRIFALFRP